MEIQFDPEKHEYTSGNIIIPGVTTVLKNVGIIEYNSFVTPGKGTRLHKIIKLYLEGALNWEVLTDEEIKFIDRFSNLTKDYKFDECEKILSNDVYLYAGTCDYINDSCIGELKTGNPEPWHLLQLAAYVWCFPSVKEGVLIYPKLKKTPVRVYTMKKLKESFKHFLCALDVYSFKQGFTILEKNILNKRDFIAEQQKL
jgi:hypothetical protein